MGTPARSKQKKAMLFTIRQQQFALACCLCESANCRVNGTTHLLCSFVYLFCFLAERTNFIRNKLHLFKRNRATFLFDGIVYGSSSSELFTTHHTLRLTHSLSDIICERNFSNQFWEYKLWLCSLFLPLTHYFFLALFFNYINSDLFAFLTSRKLSFRQNHRTTHTRYFDGKKEAKA